MRFLISFDVGAMDHIPAEEMAKVARASHAVMREAIDAGVWVFGAGLEDQPASIVTADGLIGPGPDPETRPVIGGFSIVEVSSREEALRWAQKIAVSCRCAQEVRTLMPDDEQDELLRRT